MSNPDTAIDSMIRNLHEKTGRSLAEWASIARASGHAKHKPIVQLLKHEHGLGHGYANLIAQRTLMTDAAHSEVPDLVQAQYDGAKTALKPLYEAIIGAVRKFGDDVEISPKKSNVSLRRKKQFALVQPTTATRLDIGINLKGILPEGRLEASGSFNGMVSHRVRASRVSDIDAELLGWLKRAYDAA